MLSIPWLSPTPSACQGIPYYVLAVITMKQSPLPPAGAV
jgi:hypothetical protein